MQLENLKAKVQDIFAITGLVLKNNFAKASNLISIKDAFHKQELDQEITFALCAGDLEGLEFRINMLPHVTMEEVDQIVSKFIEYQKKGVQS